MEIIVAIAAHKEYQIPPDGMYLPLQVGAHGKEDIYGVRVRHDGDGPEVDYERMARDDTGDNISEKNSLYSELTGLYWLWRNASADYCGLVHYRRHFAAPHISTFAKRTLDNVLTQRQLEPLLRETDIVLPRKRNYYIESIYSHYAHSHYAVHLDLTREVISRRCPEYLAAFDEVMRGTKAHMFNMLIMRRDRLEAYCGWLFPILEELEELVDYRAYDEFQRRFPGRVSELLLDVWLQTNGYEYRELPVMMLGDIRLGRKLASFLLAKFFGRRYRRGF